MRTVLPLLAMLLLAGCKVDLYSRLSERDANEMIAILQRADIQAVREMAKDRTVTVRVEQAQFARAVEVLKAQGLPRPSFATMGEVFARDSLISSPVEERARLIFALSQELSRTVAEIDGVLSARVHLVLPENDPLRQNAVPAAASVFIRHDPAAPLGQFTPQIKALVANSIAGLSYDKVSVVLVPAAQRPPEPLPAPPAPVAAGRIALGLQVLADDPALQLGAGLLAAGLLGGGMLLMRRGRGGVPVPRG
jgi:type III secretion protein J